MKEVQIQNSSLSTVKLDEQQVYSTAMNHFDNAQFAKHTTSPKIQFLNMPWLEGIP